MVNALPGELTVAVGGATDTGGRSTNEDAILVRPLPDGAETGYVLAVADGMGGYQGGEVASQLAIDYVRDLFAREMPADVADALKQAARRANDAIYQRAQESGGVMGTTLVAAIIQGKYLTIASIGDSRAYLARARQLTQITQDHSLVAEQVARGELTEEQARKSPQRNIVTHAVGTQERLDKRMPGIFELTLLPEDRLILCTDGFFDVLEPDDYLQALATNDPEATAHALVRLAIERKTTDNVSAVIAAVMPPGAAITRAQVCAELEPARPSLLVPVIVSIVILLIALALVGYFFLY
jgi:protein phosphatase